MFEAEAHLDSLAAIGWSMGLERIEALCQELGRPQDRFESIHVVGTNGKSSVTRMVAAIAEAHGVRSGCSLSPHLERWSERVVISGDEITPERFNAAVEQAAGAAKTVERDLAEQELVTQYELATAASFVALAEAGVELAVVEAGLGGRLDATNSLNSAATVLTSIGIDHTEFLGETELEIAAEKLAVLRPGTTLVLGEVSAEVGELADRIAAERGCRVVGAGSAGAADGAERLLAAPGEFQRRNFTVARAAAEAFLGRLEPERVGEAAAAILIPGRLEVVGEDPTVVLDVAHNRAAAAALARSLPEVSGGRPVIALLGVMSDKDAPGIIGELAPRLERAVFTELPEASLAARGRPCASSWPAGELTGLGARAGLAGEQQPEPVAALELARRRARECGGVVLVAGSHYLAPVAGAG